MYGVSHYRQVDKTATANNNFHEELEHVLNKFLKYQMTNGAVKMFSN
jgi:hypothetical protein